MKLAVVGMHAASTSGMHDHALLLTEALRERGFCCSLHWLTRGGGSLRHERAEIEAWTGALGERLAAERPDAVLLHYASFAYSYRGVPLFLRTVLRAVRQADAPLLAIMHELVYPWRPFALRSNLWAFTQRLALLALVRASAAAIVTTDYRAGWLRTRRWLPSRPLAMAPVFSNLPPPRDGMRPDAGNLLGLFGFGHEGVATELVLEAILLLRQHGTAARLTLLGSPGEQSEPGRQWRRAARGRELERQLSFSGTLPAQELSDALARCAVLLCAAAVGPTSNKGTLAAALASGRPVVATDGPRTWTELRARDAAAVVAPTAQALAEQLAALLADEARRDELGARGRALYEERMAVARSAELVAALLEPLLAGRR